MKNDFDPEEVAQRLERAAEIYERAGDYTSAAEARSFAELARGSGDSDTARQLEVQFNGGHSIGTDAVLRSDPAPDPDLYFDSGPDPEPVIDPYSDPFTNVEPDPVRDTDPDPPDSGDDIDIGDRSDDSGGGDDDGADPGGSDHDSGDHDGGDHDGGDHDGGDRDGGDHDGGDHDGGDHDGGNG